MYTQTLDPMTGEASQTQIRRDEDGTIIPFDEGNLDYREYLTWLAEGNEPNPPAPMPMQGKTNG